MKLMLVFNIFYSDRIESASLDKSGYKDIIFDDLERANLSVIDLLGYNFIV